MTTLRSLRLLLLLLAAALIVNGAATPASATPPNPAPAWLSFAGQADPALPSLAVTSADAAQIELSALIPGVQVSAQEPDSEQAAGPYTRLHGDGFGQGGEIGQPDLPVLRQSVEIPFGAQATLEVVEAKVVEYSLEELGWPGPILPLQPSPSKCSSAPGFAYDAAAYAQDAFSPAQPANLGEVSITRGHRAIMVEVWPVSYNPATGRVRLVSEMTLRIHLSGSDMDLTAANALRYGEPSFDARLSRQMLNYNQGRSVAQQSLDAPVYLIITANTYAPAMDPFVSLQQARGFTVVLTKLSDIPATTKEQIKAYISTAYTTWPVPPSYVLLVGDTNDIPAWNSTTSSGKYTDLYYFTMDGSSDWHPDMGRGRFPVRSLPQANIMVQKYLDYDAFTGGEAWLKKAAFIATCDNYTVAEGSHNYVINTYTGPEGFTGIFPANPQVGGDKIYCVTHGGNANNIRNAANDGRTAIIYSGHGGEYSWADGGVSFSQTDVRNLTDGGFFPFVASHACVTGSFNYEESFAETWVLQDGKGALVFWGASHNTYWPEDDILEKRMWDAVFDDSAPSTDVYAMTDFGLAAVETTYASSARYYWEAYNIMGDPSVNMINREQLPTFGLEVSPNQVEVCTLDGPGQAEVAVDVSRLSGMAQSVDLAAGELPDGVTAVFTPQTGAPPFSSQLTLDVAQSTLPGPHTLEVNGDNTTFTASTSFGLKVVDTTAAAPPLSLPADGALAQPARPAFAWGGIPMANSYSFQLADSPLFADPLFEMSAISRASYTLPEALPEGGCYWWRVSADNVCGPSQWSSAYRFAVPAQEPVFTDDLEAGDALWSHAAVKGVDAWQLSSDQAHSPTHAWHVPNADVPTDSRLWISAPLDVGGGSMLTFWHRYNFEGSYDGAVLEISSDAGATWQDLGQSIRSGGYNGVINANFNNPLGGRQAWVKDLDAWTKVEVSLDGYAGQSVLLRWRFGADKSTGDIGWFIDDVQVTAPTPTGLAPTLLGLAPDYGLTGEDTLVEISGENFAPTLNVRLGDTWLEAVWVDAQTLHVTVPAGLPEGLYDLELVNGDCQSVLLADAFELADAVLPLQGLELSAGGAVTMGDTSYLTATLQGGNLATYTWDFGDESPQKVGRTASVGHVYADAGVYTVTLTAENSLGSLTTTAQVTVLDVAIVWLDLSSDGPTVLGVPTLLTATLEAGSNVIFTWDCGDGSLPHVGPDASISHMYTAPGEYLVEVTATNSAGSVTQTLTVVVLDGTYKMYLPLLGK